MPVDNLDVVDMVATSKDGKEVILTISDHLDWSDEYEHLIILQEKINKYVAFIESNELLSSYPNAVGKQAVINWIGMNEPSEKAKEFFAVASEILESAGILLRTSVRP